MPSAKAWRIVAIDSSSSCVPHACHQPAPPIAHAPRPTRVICIPVRPSSTVLKPVLSMDVNANIPAQRRCQNAPSLRAARSASTRCSTRKAGRGLPLGPISPESHVLGPA